jgi:hypothetical protein
MSTVMLRSDGRPACCLPPNRRAARRPVTAGGSPAAPGDRRAARRRGGGGWLLFAVGAGLLGYLLFCHGCHGDEDNELFAVTVLKG